MTIYLDNEVPMWLCCDGVDCVLVPHPGGSPAGHIPELDECPGDRRLVLAEANHGEVGVTSRDGLGTVVFAEGRPAMVARGCDVVMPHDPSFWEKASAILDDAIPYSGSV